MRSRIAGVSLVALVACAKPRSEPVTNEASTHASPVPVSVAAIADAGADASIDGSTAEAERPDPRFVDAAPRAGKSLGHTSVVFKVELASGLKSVFKPASRRGPKRYKGEIAAYRLGSALGLGANVPRAWFRTFDAGALRNVLAAPASELFAEEAIVEGGRVKGAIQPWIDDLDFLPLERDAKWKAWLAKGASIPDEDKTLAGDIAAMICFDWLTGNWDRWSGGNVGFAKTTRRVLFVDNDGAFFEMPPKDALLRTKALLSAMGRFPKGLVTKLRAMTEGRIAEVFGEESRFVPLLSAKAIAGVIERRAELLAIVDAKTADAGEDETLFFP